AGGYGALSNWWQTQQAFGSLRVDLIDDSGPPLPPPYAPEDLEQIWRNSWNLAALRPEGCTARTDDLSAIVPFYGANLPGHRAALLSYDQDVIISGFYGLTGSEFQSGAAALADLMDPF